MNLLARTGGRMNASRNFSRGGYQNNANNGNSHFSMANGNAPRQSYNQSQSYGQNNGNRDYSNGNSAPRKRENSYDDNGRGNNNGDANRPFKRSKWDDGPAASNQPAQLMGNSRPSPPTASYSNGPSSNRNSMPYGPYPVSNGAQAPMPKSVPPPPPPSSSIKPSNGVQPIQPPLPPQGYPADYSSMYNIQYYQAIAAAAASNGGAGWQAAAYSNWPAAAAATNSAK